MRSVREIENCPACQQPLGLAQEIAELRAEVAAMRRMGEARIFLAEERSSTSGPTLEVIRGGGDDA